MDNRWTLSRRKERALYKRGIELLNDAFISMDMQPTIGVETELIVYDKDNPRIKHPLSMLEVEDATGHLNRELAYLQGSIAIGKTPIREFYKEDGKNKYETSGNPAYADEALEVNEAIQKHMRGYIHQVPGRRSTFNAVPGKKITPALHTSLGFLINGIDAFNGNTQQSMMPCRAPEAQRQVAEFMKPALCDLALLFAPKPGSYGRYTNDRGRNPMEIAVSETKDHSAIRITNAMIEHGEGEVHAFRIENRLPGTDTPLHKAILGTLLAAYDSAQQVVEMKNGRVQQDEQSRLRTQNLTPPENAAVPQSLDEAGERFRNSKRLWDLLDALSPAEKIGSKIYAHELERLEAIQKMGSPVTVEAGPETGR